MDPVVGTYLQNTEKYFEYWEIRYLGDESVFQWYSVLKKIVTL